MSESDAVLYVRICGLCGNPVPGEEMTSFWIPSRRLGNIQFNAHVGCLQRALHPSVASHFDPDDVREG